MDCLQKVDRFNFLGEISQCFVLLGRLQKPDESLYGFISLV